jgi:hypothetical protein
MWVCLGLIVIVGCIVLTVHASIEVDRLMKKYEQK